MVGYLQDFCFVVVVVVFYLDNLLMKINKAEND